MPYRCASHSSVPGVPELHCAVVEVFLNQAGRDCGLTDSGRAALSASDAQQNLAFFSSPAPESDSDFRLAPGSFTKLGKFDF
jgi:hypothetical protein